MEKVNHYKWLEKHLETFWLNVFNKTPSESGFGGVISAHGDKAYGYRRIWKKAGIPFPHGVAIFFLTYTDLLGDTPKSDSAQWVVDNYDKYKSMLPEIDENDPDIISDW